MVKYFTVFRRKKGITREQFLKYWREVHGPRFLSKNVPGLRKYVQNYPAPVTEPDLDTGVDGVLELWFDDLESAQAFHRWLLYSDGAADCREGAKQFINVEERFRFVVEENVLKE
jgi:uncharacterized protein (TIGR02118 family)